MGLPSPSTSYHHRCCCSSLYLSAACWCSYGGRGGGRIRSRGLQPTRIVVVAWPPLHWIYAVGRGGRRSEHSRCCHDEGVEERRCGEAGFGHHTIGSALAASTSMLWDTAKGKSSWMLSPLDLLHRWGGEGGLGEGEGDTTAPHELGHYGSRDGDGEGGGRGGAVARA